MTFRIPYSWQTPSAIQANWKRPPPAIPAGGKRLLMSTRSRVHGIFEAFQFLIHLKSTDKSNSHVPEPFQPDTRCLPNWRVPDIRTSRLRIGRVGQMVQGFGRPNEFHARAQRREIDLRHVIGHTSRWNSCSEVIRLVIFI
jgi:hypothetical protein